MPRVLVSYTGKTIDGAIVLGRNLTEVQTQTKWDLRCKICGTEFVCASEILKQRRHLHHCPPQAGTAWRPPTAPVPVREAAVATRDAVERITAATQPNIIPMPTRQYLKPRRPLTPTEQGYQEARAYLGGRYVTGNFVV